MRASNLALLLPCLLALGACKGELSGGGDSGGETFVEPDEIVSQNGELHTTFTVADSTVQVAGKSLHTLAYNNVYMPPLLHVKPGDTIFLNLDNESGQPTNEHYHGLNVSPRINDDATVSDNILVQADPGTQVNYKIQIPADHNPGLYWYHAHLHGQAERQVMGGLSGGLIVDGVLDPFPELKGIKERVFLLKDVQITSDGTLPDDIDPGADTNRTINGKSSPTLRLDENQLQFWRFANIGADMYYKLVLDGHVFYELARDGNRHNKLVEMRELLLPPGSRSEVLVRGGAPGSYKLHTLEVNTGPDGDDYAAANLATVITRPSALPGMQLPNSFPPVEDYRTCPSRSSGPSRSRKTPPTTRSSWTPAPGLRSSMRIVSIRRSSPAPWRNGRSTTPRPSCMCSTFTRPTSRSFRSTACRRISPGIRTTSTSRFRPRVDRRARSRS